MRTPLGKQFSAAWVPPQNFLKSLAKIPCPGCPPDHLNEHLWGWDKEWVLVFTRYTQEDSDVSETAAITSPTPKAMHGGARCLIVSWLSHTPWLDMESKKWPYVVASCLSWWHPSSYWVLEFSVRIAPKCSHNLRSTPVSTSALSWGWMESGMN